MHREIQEQIEAVLADSQPVSGSSSSGKSSAQHAREHLAQCSDCKSEVEAMEQQTALLRALRAPEDFAGDVRPGFYARVMERIEAQGPLSIWNLFIESAFGRRIAVASLALTVLLGVYLVTSEHSAQDPVITAQGQADRYAQALVAGEDAPAREITQVNQSASNESSEDAVLANLVTYREQ